MLKWLVLPMVVLAYLAATVSAGAPRDRDHDRLPDRWEWKHHLSPTTPSAKRDPDGDHLRNRRELGLRTHPRRADTDRDRLRDGAEVRRFHTNPRKRDSDGDGFRDRCELRKGTKPRKRRSHPKRRCSKSPSSVVYVAPTRGAKVSGVTPVRVRAPAGTDWIGVYACGGSVGEDLVRDANGEWWVQWDTQVCSNGQQTLDTWAFRDDGSDVGNATITVEVGNSSSPPPDAGPTPCEPSVEPEPVAGQGYSMRFSDCFGTLSRTVWCSNQWWEPNPPVGTQYVEDGVLHLVRRRADGYPNNTISSEPCGQAHPQSFRRGYFEARLRWTGVPGSGPAFWLFSTAHATDPRWPQPACPEPTCLSAEIDVFEGYGNHLDVFTGTIHRNSCGCYGEPSRMNSNNWQPQPGMDLSGWHVYAARWTGTDVTWYLDGRRIMSAPVYDSTDQPMHLLFYNWATPWEGGNETGAATPDQLHTEVDWVRVWQQ
jgi:Glycosyl hydrolases family 16